LNVALKYRDRVDTAVMLPRVNWRQPSNERRAQAEHEPVPVTKGSLEIIGESAAGDNGNGRSTKRGRSRLNAKVGS